MSTDSLALSCLFSPEDHLRLNPLGVTLPLRRLLGPPAPEDAGSQWRAGLRKGWHMGCSQQQEGVTLAQPMPPSCGTPTACLAVHALHT